MINLEKNNEKLQHNIQVAREHKIVLPTFAQMKNPDLVPEKIKEGLKKVGLWDVDPLNLFRITWHNEPTMQGGTYGGVNFIEIPSSLSGVKDTPVSTTFPAPSAATFCSSSRVMGSSMSSR